MKDFEKSDAFYLGKILDIKHGKVEGSFLYDSKNLNTHAVCVGMTGSGKTGLGISLLEEAGLDGIPAIIIDPKGDLTNLLLTFPDLSPEEFKPWIDESAAKSKGISLEEYSESIAKKWKDGLASSGEDQERIRKLRHSVDLKIYTPASQMGTPISILNSFTAPSKEEMLDTAAVREKIQSITSSLLGLVGLSVDPIKSREHILVATLIDDAWEKGHDLSIADLIQLVQQPPFDKIGALPLDTFYPPKERMELSISLNNLLASPGFKVWLEGDPLDIEQLLYTKERKPKLSIVSIMHLSDSERMFFVTLLLNEFLTWMRKQSGTSNLRALLYMDEIFGFFPPTSNPPSKLPMLTLLKQARAYGIGIVLVTQNPVDLDYKGLANCGTWFIGRLQTERDKLRVVEGLQAASNGEFNAKTFDAMLALTGNRRFILRSIYESEPLLFQTRWTLSFLRGPLTLAQIASLTEKSLEVPEKKSDVSEKNIPMTVKPFVSSGISECFAHSSANGQPEQYKPCLAAFAKLHFIDAKNKIDTWQDVSWVLSVDEKNCDILWEKTLMIPDLKNRLDSSPIAGSIFENLPTGLADEKNYRLFEKKFAAELYQTQVLTTYRSPDLNLTSHPGESEDDFRKRLAFSANERHQELVQKLQEKHSEKLTILKNKIRRAQEKLDQKQQKAFTQKLQTGLSFLATILKALFGRKVTQGTITQTEVSLRRASQIGKNSQDRAQAEQDLRVYEEQLQNLQSEMDSKIESLLNENSKNLELTKIFTRPRKSDICIEKISLLWWPSQN